MNKTPRVIARFGLMVCFVSFGVWEIVKPAYWVSYVPEFVARLTDPALLVRIHGALLLVVGLMILVGILRKLASLAAVLLMLEIVVSLIISSGFTEILIRDVTILLLATALLVDSWQRDWR